MKLADIHFLITARGGSKGIPRKNLQTIGGIPLVARSILAVHSSGLATRAVVSTDDSEIAEIATSYGAEVLVRPTEISRDESSSELAILHFLTSTRVSQGTLVLIQPTSPFLLGDDLVRLTDATKEFDSCLTVTESHGFLWRLTSAGTLVGQNHDHGTRLRRQDQANSEYLENGAAYAMNVEMFMEYKHRFFGKIGFIVMPRERSIEIDSLSDLRLAECLHESMSAQ